ncbi:MAG: hypothetical protein AAGL29_07495 [Bacteroidota bacterium]
MATKTTNKVEKKSLNDSLVNATMATINTTVEHGEKWQKLTKKLVKKSEPVRRKQMDMVFETATEVKAQFNSGKERMLDLVGYDGEVVERAMEYATQNPVSKKVIKVAGSVKETITENPVVKQVEKTTENLKAKGTAKLNDLKEDVLEQAQKILNKGEEIVEDALDTKKKVKKQAKAKATKAKAKAVATTKKVVVEAEPIVQKVKEVEKKVVDTVKDDLKLIHGIGPKLETIFNQNGIITYAQLAKISEAKMRSILEKAGPVFKNANFADWMKEAEKMSA